MRKIKAILRLHFEARLSRRQIARSLGIGYGTVSDYLDRAAQAALDWPLDPSLDDRQLLCRLFPSQPPGRQRRFAEPDFAQIHLELKRKGVTRLLLWYEYREQHPDDGYSYTQFCERYKQWCSRQQRSMRQTHRAGEKLFVDYCGPTIPIINPDTGEVRQAQIFVAVLGASNYSFACAHFSQRQADWLDAHVKAFEFFGGVTELIVPDQLKSAVRKSHRYEPLLNDAYLQLAEHYSTAILPARPVKPKDKAKVETAVLLVERWIMARLRHQQFFTLAALNHAIRDLLEELNHRPFQKLPGTRRSQFEQLDQPLLRPLPKAPFQYTTIKQARVHIDYHIEFDKHYYSVPHALVRHTVEVQASNTTVAIYHQGQRVATHVRNQLQRYGHTTLPEHMPPPHRFVQQWSPERFLKWAYDIGPATRQVVAAILQEKRHREQSYRRILALLSNAKKVGRPRLEKACERAVSIGSPTRSSVESILKKGLDQLPLDATESSAETDTATEHHANIRGAHYYH